MKTKGKVTIWVLLVFGYLGCGSEGPDRPSNLETGPPVSVKVDTVSQETVRHVYSATGTVKPRVSTSVSSQVVGTVTAVQFDAGDRVQQGQLLVEIDSREWETRLARAQAGLDEARSGLQEVERSIEAAHSSLESARANADLAEATFKRFEGLLARKSVSQQEFDEVETRQTAARADVQKSQEMVRAVEARKAQIEAKITQSKAELSNAELYLSYTKICAPIGGYVVTKSVEVGQLASPEGPLLVIDDPRQYRLEAVVDESQMQFVRIGQEVLSEIAALDVALTGRVDEIVPVADPDSRSFTVKISLPPTDGVRAGLYGKAQFSTEEKEVILLPKSAVVERGQLVGVYVIDPAQKARLRLIQTGKDFGEKIEVLSGLSAGDQIISVPRGEIRDGIDVTPTSSVELR